MHRSTFDCETFSDIVLETLHGHKVGLRFMAYIVQHEAPLKHGVQDSEPCGQDLGSKALVVTCQYMIRQMFLNHNHHSTSPIGFKHFGC